MRIRDRLVLSGVISLLLSGTILAESVNLKNENNTTYSESKVVDEKLEDEKILIYNTISIVPIFYDAKNNIFIKDWSYLKSIDNRLKSDKAFILECSKLGADVFVFMDDKLKKDREFIAEVLKIEPRLFKYIDESLQKDRDFLIQTNRLLYKNRETVLRLIRDKKTRAEGIDGYFEENGFRLDNVDEVYRSDREIAIEAVKQVAWNINNVDERLKRDREILEIAIRGGAGLSFANKKMLQDKELILEYLSNGGFESDLQYIDPKLKKDRAFALEAVKRNGASLVYFDDVLKKDREVVISAVKNNGYALKYADKRFKQDQEIVLMALQKSGYGLQYASLELRDNKEFVLEVLKKNWKAHKYLSDRLKKDRDAILMAMRYFWGCGEGDRLYDMDKSLKKDKLFMSKFLDTAPYQIESMDEDLKKDRTFVKSIIKKHPIILNPYTINGEFGKFIKQDNRFILSMIKKSGNGLGFATKEQKADRALVLKAISLDDRAFGYADESLRRDKKFILKVAKLTKNKKDIFWASDIDKNLTKDRAFVMEMLEINPHIFSSIDEDLQKDKSFILNILKNREINHNEIYIYDELFRDKKFVADVARLTGRGLQYATTEQQDNRTLVLEAIEHNIKASYFMSDRLHKDKKVLNAIEEIKNPLWKKIFTPLNILLVFLFGYWWSESKKRNRDKEI